MNITREAFQGRNHVMITATFDYSMACGVFRTYYRKYKIKGILSLVSSCRYRARLHIRVQIFSQAFNDAPPAEVTKGIRRKQRDPSSSTYDNFGNHCTNSYLCGNEIRDDHLARQGQGGNLRAVSSVTNRGSEGARATLFRYNFLCNVSFH